MRFLQYSGVVASLYASTIGSSKKLPIFEKLLRSETFSPEIWEDTNFSLHIKEAHFASEDDSFASEDGVGFLWELGAGLWVLSEMGTKV